MNNIARKLLREWKYLIRHSPESQKLFFLKPQDSDIHLWHLVLSHPQTGMEIYLVLYINIDELRDIKRNNFNSHGHAFNNNGVNSNSIIMRCITPNLICPINKNISVTHLRVLLKENGFNGLIHFLWSKFFDPINDTRFCTNNNIQKLCKLGYIWNRTMSRSFRSLFPEIIGTLQQGDYLFVKEYSKRLRMDINNDIFGTCNVSTDYNNDINTSTMNTSIEIPCLSTNPSDILACDSTPSQPLFSNNFGQKRLQHDDSTNTFNKNKRSRNS
ncbi:hypothetical protein TBLA_0B04320 [Henningerozyma blattae CBS 6284]|uniref:Uncharacterized protein n=1 Tax=Henningerozyma blattae (strain ATCC 34711 / CBS 6284 / DSM 70876 / NBRC 10599 / NRRL Y-10934 / UCD 77-7) TaxID=1071380 RepID=I2GYR7_HENB6|nr:hypothetical protein TBLA_0B04320 [Tetrapisispora blattae CBS 6284]CCH59269.1 hypothetical protein TBLA_0B04320 [Tetrapisispora blattae CBS 6284]